jgi:hypothetical protein
MIKRLGWALAGMPFGALAGGLCGTLVGVVAAIVGMEDPVTGERHQAEIWYLYGALFGALSGAILFAFLWSKHGGPPGRKPKRD